MLESRRNRDEAPGGQGGLIANRSQLKCVAELMLGARAGAKKDFNLDVSTRAAGLDSSSTTAIRVSAVDNTLKICDDEDIR